MWILALVTLALSAADHWTTYLCLRQPVEGWTILEANPISNWLFGSLGLVPGLLLDSALTIVAIVFLVNSRTFPNAVKAGFFLIVIGWTGYAVHNNLLAIAALGLSPLGGPAS